jgi:hypothetical protein
MRSAKPHQLPLTTPRMCLCRASGEGPRAPGPLLRRARFGALLPQPREMQLGAALSVSKVPRSPGPLLPRPGGAQFTALPSSSGPLYSAASPTIHHPLLLQAPPPQPHRAASALFLVTLPNDASIPCTTNTDHACVWPALGACPCSALGNRLETHAWACRSHGHV